MKKLEAGIGFEPMNTGFPDPSVRPLQHPASGFYLLLQWSDGNVLKSTTVWCVVTG